MFPDFSTGRSICFVFIGWTIPAGTVILSDRKCTAVFCTAERIFRGKLYSSSEKIRRFHRPCGRQPPAGPDPHHQLLPRGRPAGPSVRAQCLRFLPWWAVQFRRLHDTDRSAWWALLFLIPFIGWLIIIVFNCQAGTPGENRFGPDPKLEQE